MVSKSSRTGQTRYVSGKTLVIKPFKRHIVNLRNGKSRAFQIATLQHIAFVASVGSLFGETMVCVISLIAALRSSSLCLLCGMRYIS